MLDYEPAGTNYSNYVSALDKWLGEMILMNHHGSKAMVAQVKSRYESNMKANMQFHSDMARAADGQQQAKHHRQMAELYRALLPTS